MSRTNRLTVSFHRRNSKLVKKKEKRKKRSKRPRLYDILFPFDWLNKRSGEPRPDPSKASSSRTGSRSRMCRSENHRATFPRANFSPFAIDRSWKRNSWRESPRLPVCRLARELIRSTHEYVDVLHDRVAMRVDRESQTMESNGCAAVAIKVGSNYILRRLYCDAKTVSLLFAEITSASKALLTSRWWISSNLAAMFSP